MTDEALGTMEVDASFAQIIEFNYTDSELSSSPDLMSIDDMLYGKFEFDANNSRGDAAIIDLIQSEPFKRLEKIEQLILPAEFATRPETAGFTRMEHSIGVMLLVRRLGGSEEQQIRALLHDIAQTAFSHLGDWLKQGMDGEDDYHDRIQLQYVRDSGIDSILAAHGFNAEGILLNAPKDFVERPSPDLCADRVDYALREFARWTCPDDVPSLIEDLAVKDDMIVFGSQVNARIFSHNYIELFWGHWAHDEHAAKETLFFFAVKRAIESGAIDEQDMYSTDDLVLQKMEAAEDEVIDTVLSLLRMSEFEFVGHKGTQGSLSLDTDIYENDTDHLYFRMRHFRPRHVDPSYLDEDTGERILLSAVDADHRGEVLRHLEFSGYEYGLKFIEMFKEELLYYIKLKVPPEAKQVLNGVGEFR